MLTDEMRQDPSIRKAFELGENCFLDGKKPEREIPYPKTYKYHCEAFYEGYNSAKQLFIEK